MVASIFIKEVNMITFKFKSDEKSECDALQAVFDDALGKIIQTTDVVSMHDGENSNEFYLVIGGNDSAISQLHNSICEININDINYISEGFLSRYLYSLKPKSTGFFSKLLKAISVVAVLAAATAATIFTCGAAGVAIGGTLVSLSAGTLGTIGLVSGITVGVAATAAGAQTLALKARQARNSGKVHAVKGRNDTIPKGYKREEQKESRKLI